MKVYRKLHGSKQHDLLNCTEVLKYKFSLSNLLLHESKGTVQSRFLWITGCGLYYLAVLRESNYARKEYEIDT